MQLFKLRMVSSTFLGRSELFAKNRSDFHYSTNLVVFDELISSALWVLVRID